MSYEWMRVITVMLATLTVIELLIIYKKNRVPGLIAPICWLLLIIGYDVLKFIVKSDPLYYDVSVILVNAIFVYGIVMLLVAGYLFRDIKSWHQN